MTPKDELVKHLEHYKFVHNQTHKDAISFIHLYSGMTGEGSWTVTIMVEYYDKKSVCIMRKSYKPKDHACDDEVEDTLIAIITKEFMTAGIDKCLEVSNGLEEMRNKRYHPQKQK